MSSDYIKQLEAENEELRNRLSSAETDLIFRSTRTPKWTSVGAHQFYYGFRNIVGKDDFAVLNSTRHTTNLASVGKLKNGEWHVMTIHDYGGVKKLYEKKFKNFDDATKYVERIFSNDK